jgi:hypothetical protein
MDKDRINHVVPLNDEHSHLIDSYYDMANQLVCRCGCKPNVKAIINECDNYIIGFTIIHNSFDGREAVEWANEILKESDKNK